MRVSDKSNEDTLNVAKGTETSENNDTNNILPASPVRGSQILSVPGAFPEHGADHQPSEEFVASSQTFSQIDTESVGEAETANVPVLQGAT